MDDFTFVGVSYDLQIRQPIMPVGAPDSAEFTRGGSPLPTYISSIRSLSRVLPASLNLSRRSFTVSFARSSPETS